MKLYKISTLGCKVNQYDACAAEKILQQAGFQQAQKQQKCSIVLVNTCCITAVAMRKSRQAMRKLTRENPQAVICIIGCYSTYHADAISQVLTELDIPETSQIIAGHHENVSEAILQAIEAATCQSAQVNAEPQQKKLHNQLAKTPETIKARRKVAVSHDTIATQHLPPIDQFTGRQRAFVKVQDGCDAFCNYCVVPYTRSKVWSKSIDEIISECQSLVQNGHREIVLCGVFLGAFGQQTSIRRKWENQSPTLLAELVEKVSQIPDLWRVRLSSLEPGDVNQALIDVAKKCKKFAPHLHLPLQAGSERILKKMNRQYTAAEFLETAKILHEIWDRPALSTDIIVGYPGETDEDFEQTLAVAKASNFSKIHAFPFSAIEPTQAWQIRHEMPNPQIVKQRIAKLVEIETENSEKYRKQFLGEKLTGLVESTKLDNNQARAMTDRYIAIDFDLPAGLDLENITGKLVELEIIELSKAGVAGKFVKLID